MEQQMTDVQHQESSAATKLARLERLCGRFPVLTSENRQDYEELLTSLLEAYCPRNFLGERLVKSLADEEWEISRCKRNKVLLLERRLRERLVFQAYRQKAAQADKAALTHKLVGQPRQWVLPEEVLEGLVAEVDDLLQRPAEELDHARALEVCIVYFERLDRLLNAAIVRRRAILADIERYDYLFDTALSLSVMAEDMHDSALVEHAHAIPNEDESETEGNNAQADEVAPPLAPPDGSQS
jgi:hypothetical protein